MAAYPIYITPAEAERCYERGLADHRRGVRAPLANPYGRGGVDPFEEERMVGWDIGQDAGAVIDACARDDAFSRQRLEEVG